MVAHLLDPHEERPGALAAAQAAFDRYQTDLRRLGAIGEIGVGYDPDAAVLTRWWARCSLRRPPGAPVPLMVQGHASGFDALGALVDAAATWQARPR